MSVALVAVLIVGCAMNRVSDGNILDLTIPMSMNNAMKEPHFSGTVTQLYDNVILVNVNENEDVHSSSDLISVSLDVKVKNCMTHFTIGDEVIVYYNGEITESYLAQVNTVYAIVLTSQDMKINIDDLNTLFAMRTPYVGDNSAVGNILSVLPRIDREHTQKFFSISDDYGTGYAPFTLTVYYEPNGMETSAEENRLPMIVLQNSALLFALIGNLEEVTYAFRSTPSDNELDTEAYSFKMACNKNEVSEYLDTIGLTWEDFHQDWNNSIERLFIDVLATGELPVTGIDRNKSNSLDLLRSSWTPLAKLPADYSMEQAIADSVFVNIHGNPSYNQDLVDKFYKDVFSGTEAFLRVMQYTIEGDAIITDYQFDGRIFMVTKDNTRDQFGNKVISTTTYKHLIPIDRSHPAFSDDLYVLSNVENIFTTTEDTTIIDGVTRWIPSPSDYASKL